MNTFTTSITSKTIGRKRSYGSGGSRKGRREGERMEE
jgi:hypothetical protein